MLLFPEKVMRVSYNVIIDKQVFHFSKNNVTCNINNSINYAFMNEIPQIVLWGITFTEPTTFLTDMLVVAVCASASVKIYRNAVPSSRQNFRLLFLILIGISAFAGGIYHLLRYYVSDNLAYASWIVSASGIFMLEMWTLSFLQDKRRLIFLSIAASALFIASFAGVLIMKTFFPIVLRSIIGVFAIVVPARLQTKNDLPSDIFKFFTYGVAFSILSGIAYIPALSIHKWFNNADMGHVLLAVSMYYFYLTAAAEKKAGY
jgi:hypothetical protein